MELIDDRIHYINKYIMIDNFTLVLVQNILK